MGEVRSEGLVYRVLPDGASVALVGWYGTAPEADVLVPASVTSGEDSYTVALIGEADGNNSSSKVFADSKVTTLTLPSSVQDVIEGALSGCPSLARIEVSPKNETFSSFDGMLFSKDLSSLLTVPEGKEGAAHIPDQTSSVPASAFSQAPGLQSVEVGEGSVTFASRNGVLYSKDLTILVTCPPGAGQAAVIPAEVERIGEHAFAGCSLASITALGFVREIAPDAFSDEAKSAAVVALPAGEDYEARKAVWETAGFTHFAEPAKPGDTVEPEPSAPEEEGGQQVSGLAFELLEDYTLAVSWKGPEGPEGILDIPATAQVGGVSYRVSALADAAFAGCAKLTGVTLPASITRIGERAFEATGLSDMWLSTSVASVGSRAFAACGSLTRIVALGSPEVAKDVLAECSGVNVYCPSDSEASWYPGLPAAGNHVLPYGVSLLEEPLHVEVGQSANLLEGGSLHAPDPTTLSYSYAAKPLSVDSDGTVTGKAEGSSEVLVSLVLEEVELARALRTVEVAAAPAAEEPVEETESAVLASQPATISQTVSLMSLSSEVPASDVMSYTAALTTGETFTAKAPTGQSLKCTVLASDPSTVEVVCDADQSTYSHLVIPAKVKDQAGKSYTVKGMGTGSGVFRFSSVAFEQGSEVTYLADKAFVNYQLMKEISLPETLETIGAYAFINCFNLQAIEIPDSVTEIGERAFMRCLVLSSVVLGKGVGTLPSGLFYGDFYLGSVHVRGSIQSFGSSVFAEFDPAAVKVHVASEADKETWIKENASRSYGLNPDNIIYSTDMCTVTFKECGDFASDVRVPVEKGASVSELAAAKQGHGLAGWYEDEGLTKKWEFGNPVQSDMTLYPKWVEDVVEGDLAFSLRSDGSSVSVRAVDPESLQGDIVIPDKVRIGNADYPIVSVGSKGFAGSKISTVVLPRSLEVIEFEAFAESSLAAIDFSTSSLKTIELGGFRATDLKKVVIPKSVQEMKRAAFYGCPSLETVTFEQGSAVTYLPDECFNFCEKLKSVALPEGMQSIEYQAFFRCSGLLSITLPDSLKMIGTEAFSLCTSLASVSLPAGLEKLSSNAFGGSQALGALLARSSLGKIGSQITTVFTSAQKAAITVVLPATGDDGSTYNQMKDAWTSYGFSKFSPMGGALPLESDAPGSPNADPAKAGWSIDTNGALKVWSTGKLADFMWRHTGTEFREQYWGPVRSLVKSVDTTGVHSAYSLWAWFRNMPNLSDISKFAVPAETVEVIDVFTRDEALTEIPAIAFPDSVTSLWACFNGCTSIERIADGFKLPANLTNAKLLFGENSSLAELPATFVVPDSVTDASGMFSDCSSLVRLPQGFELPRNIENASDMFMGCASLEEVPAGIFAKSGSLGVASRMFQGCTSLASLPDGFAVPAAVTDARWMFQNCTSLASLPDGFSTPVGCDVTNMFLVESGLLVGGQKLPTYYAGTGLVGYDWAASNRTLVAPSAKPNGAKTVTLNVKEEGQTGPGEYWTTAYTDGSGLLAEPVAPSRTGYVFTLWYADEACTQRVDFSQAFTADATLYGKFASGTHGGTLPTEAGSGAAWWSLSDDGTLYIRGAGTVTSLGWENQDYSLNPTTGYWSDYRLSVHKVSLSLSLKTKTMNHWFCQMPELVDVSETFLPQGVTDVAHLFDQSSRLESLPQGYVLPEGVTLSMAMFRGTGVRFLPATFLLPNSLEDANSMFTNSKIETLPEGFTFGETNVMSARFLFNLCGELRSLPEGFSFSKRASHLDLYYAFNGCSKLSVLPEGFTIPSKVKLMGPGITPIDRLFGGCNSLTTLPSSFDFPSELASGAEAPFGCDVAEGDVRVATYYAGSNPTVLNYDWESQNRTLVTNSADMGEWGMRQVKLQVQSVDEAAGFPWETRSVAWTNKQGVLADPGEPQLEGYRFSGWCVDEDCLEPVDFSQPIPAGVDTLYGKWLIAGGKNAVDHTGGELLLATDSPAGTSAWWRITADGQLDIRGDGKVGNLELSWNPSSETGRYWAPYRSKVKKIVMDERLGAERMTGWFCRMPKLTDATSLAGVFVPEGVVSVSDMFYSCTNLTEIPSGFSLPESVTALLSMFHACTSLKTLPDSFQIPPYAANVENLFQNCVSLSSLPQGFTMPDTVTEASSMFLSCWSLRALPENFKVSKRVISMSDMFRDCNALTYFPASFDFPLAVASGSTDPFLYEGEGTLDTYYAGGATGSANVTGYSWASQMRTLVTAEPVGKALVKLHVPNKQTGDFELWTSQLAAIDSTAAVPDAPAREGFTFTGWYSDKALTTPYDFSTSVVPAEGLELYACYQANSGTLPTIDADGVARESAEWVFDETTRTLTIRCTSEGAVIQHLFETSLGEKDLSHWRPIRHEVERVVVEPNVDAVDMDGWLRSMTSLETVEELAILPSTRSVQSMFWGCSALRSLPEGFTIPEHVVQCSGMFMGCSSLKTLPSSFRMPPVVNDIGSPYGLNNFFYGCSSLESLPEGFVLPEVRTGNLSGMFYGCTSLKSLPAGFDLRDAGTAVTEANGLFYGCSSLVSLPAGFAIPAGWTNLGGMFYGCTSLKTLPAGFGFEGPENVTNVSSMFRNCPALTALPSSLDLSGLTNANLRGFDTMFAVDDHTADNALPTLYAKADGAQQADLGKLLAPTATASDPAQYWKTAFHRELYAEGGSPSLPAGTYAVTFKTRDSATGAWTEAFRVLTDSSSKVPDPGYPERFGYVFSGWCSDESCLESTRFNFQNDTVTQDTVLYGTYAMVVSVDVPFQVKTTVDAAGNTTDAPLAFVSRTPVPLEVSSVSGSLASGASKLFPNAAEREGVEVRIGLGSMSFGVFPGSTDSSKNTSRLIADLPAATAAEAKTLEGTLSVERHGAQIDYQPGEDITSLAKLTWTVGVA